MSSEIDTQADDLAGEHAASAQFAETSEDEVAELAAALRSGRATTDQLDRAADLIGHQFRWILLLLAETDDES